MEKMEKLLLFLIKSALLLHARPVEMFKSLLLVVEGEEVWIWVVVVEGEELYTIPLMLSLPIRLSL